MAATFPPRVYDGEAVHLFYIDAFTLTALFPFSFDLSFFNPRIGVTGDPRSAKPEKVTHFVKGRQNEFLGAGANGEPGILGTSSKPWQLQAFWDVIWRCGEAGVAWGT